MLAYLQDGKRGDVEALIIKVKDEIATQNQLRNFF